MWDTARKITFVLFTGAGNPTVEAERVRDVITAQPKGNNEFALRLRRAKTESRLVVSADGTGQPSGMPETAYIFEGPAVWELTLMGSRIQLAFDAMGYKELAGRDTTLASVCARIAPNLARLVDEVGLRFNRAALQLHLEGFDGTNTSAIIQKRFGANLHDHADTTDVRDVMIRRNLVTDWELSATPHKGNRVEINRLETATEKGGYRNNERFASLVWLFDINTSPAALSTLTGENIACFFKHASEWVDTQEKSVNDLATAV